jgi:DNA repair protein RadC
MRSLAPQDRPREKLDRLGASSLGDNELLAVLLGHGFRRTSALELANRVLDASAGLHGLTRRTLSELERIKGIGRAKALQILAAVELGRRTLVRAPAPRVQFATPRDAAVHLLPQYGARGVEHFGVVLLDAKHRLLKVVLVSVGTLDASLVHPREVFREAALAGAAAIILFHNHPSGDPSPSDDDMKLTARLVDAGALMGIDVIDHLILADARYCSLKEMRRL